MKKALVCKYVSGPLFTKFQQQDKLNGWMPLLDFFPSCDVFVTMSLYLSRAHEHWDLPEPPCIVAFAKKMLVGGYYFGGDFLPKQVRRFCLCFQLLLSIHPILDILAY